MVRKMVAAVLVGGGGGYVVLFGIRKAFACLGHSQKSRQGEGKENRTGKAGNTFLRAWPRNERVEWKMLAHVYFFFFFFVCHFRFLFIFYSFLPEYLSYFLHAPPFSLPIQQKTVNAAVVWLCFLIRQLPSCCFSTRSAFHNCQPAQKSRPIKVQI